MDTLVYGREELKPRVVSVVVLPNHLLLLQFDNGEKREYDFTPHLKFPVYSPLRNEEVFRLASIAYGSVCWPGEIDICPDTLYELSTPVSEG